MELVTPGIGLMFWTSIAFLLLLFLLSKFAWTPILNAVNERELKIEKSLQEAEKAREEILKLTVNNEKMLAEAKEERSKIISEAKVYGEKLIEEAREKSKVEAQKLIVEAKAEINIQKMAAITEVKNQVGNMVLDLSEKLLKRELSDKSRQENYTAELINDIKLN